MVVLLKFADSSHPLSNAMQSKPMLSWRTKKIYESDSSLKRAQETEKKCIDLFSFYGAWNPNPSRPIASPFFKKISTQHAKSVAKSPVIIIIGRAFEATEYFYNEFVTVCFLIMFDTKINQPSPFILFPSLPFSFGLHFSLRCTSVNYSATKSLEI